MRKLILREVDPMQRGRVQGHGQVAVSRRATHGSLRSGVTLRREEMLSLLFRVQEARAEVRAVFPYRCGPTGSGAKGS